MRNKRIFFLPHPHTPADKRIIAVIEGELGYHLSHDEDQAHADLLNQRLGNTPAELEAAELCSMFDRWPEFHEIARAFAAEEITAEEVAS